ncbi:putative protein kinase RLK-Pelle-CrRLK1L-1 family [Helianthus annuus]|uniref:Putative mitogen-activated protein (MAP) kinase, ERK3/4, Phloem protein 2-like protein n=1 Tax=Helianthus annuus TaxID=4232 RepID=A0A251V943_HELAN|nr:tyrosine-protein kinase receptor TYRO3 [Helianthus annuus]KAF5815589.1 putative protein kinase RLK-Pelle-CrRLK1L-1 family [Helianthus annuus]KAJ0594026.1 putative protein kinase RLK-Pelle-CrRLK1L-1 family [Helianthus annuus]KAJ0602093.1 putative protein kinase RLK-Pelle-CrRLK1L-1 family [Helianthus annuus]KAJ0609046.1 putative protein kinase RLK-Pelle-CrRLK1L-1 family [Helianthus annuus]KAJ0769111.1 putative protein kinase RLK-Pelle-CrRLK1L-1 family [Helianthus annuus]
MESFVNEFKHLKIQFEDIIRATNTFDDLQIIGRGGFGKVYSGQLSHFKGRSMVAIKRLDRIYGQGDVEFWKEITILNRFKHENLITLLGFCNEGDQMILVYEHASKESLDRHLSSTNFTWRQRLKTCIGAARGLSFLHDAPAGTNERIIHRDIKSANILLDANWNAKVSDMGLSKIAPANQQRTGLVTDRAGTIGYCDPSYMETYCLTKESDVYSFGVVLFEVLCGRLCFKYSNGQTQVFVPTWKKSYEQNNLQQIIFDYLKQQIDPTSLKTYADIAFKCLQKSPKKRPTMPDVVKELETALEYQELYEGVKLTEDFKRMLPTAADNLNYGSESELKMLLLKGILTNNGNTWLSCNKNGDHCETLSIAACLTSTSRESHYINLPIYTERFTAGCYEPRGAEFKTHVKTQFLSPKITYTVNLVFKRMNSEEQYIGLEYKLEGEKEKSYSFVSDKREGGWLTVELYQLSTDQGAVDLKIVFYTKHCDNLLIEGIEFQPLEKVDTETRPAEDGRQCLMLPAKVVLDENEWNWVFDPRFGQVADCIAKKIGINCEFSSEKLSPQTTYAAYLVYRLPHNYKDINPPVQVVDKNSGSGEEYNIFLRTPQTPVIRGNDKIKGAYNPSIRPMIKGLPKNRSDGWMEVQVHEFITPASIRMITTRLQLSSYDMSLAGITVQGLEFRPI